MVSYSSPRGKLLRSAWHLIRVALIAQCGRTGRGAVLEQLPKDVVALFFVSHHHSAHGGAFDSQQLTQTPLIEIRQQIQVIEYVVMTYLELSV